ncbi:MAG: type II toxin-antitoxin system RelE/ParE family toxin [Dehalococcoidia bacterium]|nr:type II toxin-antitoxin system RelE/ParE family toxin [Dehalococcoidia bacterium]
MIQSFGDRATEDIYHARTSIETRRLPPELVRAARRRLDMLLAAKHVRDLAAPPGNRLEALRGDLAGYWSIRVNQQWRLVFRWMEDGAHDVRLMDYH